MNALLLAGIGVLLLWIGYVFYSRKVAEWLGIDHERTTPAVSMNDGVDYVPAKHWLILFGHHFSSIAGAAPIIGPVIACLLWGWLPAVIWITVGGVLFGAVHDFSSLTLSVRHKGRSVADLTESVLGRGAQIVFSLFVFLALILIVAVFAATAGKTLASTPQVVVPTFGLILVAIFIGFLMYRTNVPLLASSIIGLLMLFGLMVAGYYIPLELPVENAARWWTVILLAYGLLASVTPVHVLLQPRDYLSAGVLVIGMGAGFLGLAIVQPAVKAPAVVSFTATKGWLWPMLFVTIACGAISGFHSLVASGTTSKQLPRVRDARLIGFGGMIAESALALLAVIAVTAGLYWKQVPSGAEGYVYQELMKGNNWILTFGRGYGELTKPLFLSLGYMVGIIMLNTFVMTTLDSATRITRYVCTELFGDSLNIKPLKNRYIATGLVGLLAGGLALTNWQAIWPIFGSANQLVASLVLISVSAYLMTRGRNYVFTIIPALLMLVTTMGALVFKIMQFQGVLPGERKSTLLTVISAVLIVLGLFVVYKGAVTMKKALGTQTEAAADMQSTTA